jgi:membrane protease YdiL (CAAX protease family)
MPAYLATLRRHPGCATFLVTLTSALAADGLRRHALGRTLVYCAAVALSVLAVDLVLSRWPINVRPVPVRSPRLETAVAAIMMVVGFGSLAALFIGQYRPSSILARLLFVAIGLGSAFGVTLIIFLLARRYRWSDLGVRSDRLFLALPIAGIFFALAWTFTRGSILNVVHSRESFMAWLTTMPVAALSEEFLRFVWQTRVAALRGNKAFGWIIASCAWAVMHGPRFWGENGFVHGTLGTMNIIPIGLLLGYVTHRSQSFLPAALAHATNVWGLQNL